MIRYARRESYEKLIELMMNHLSERDNTNDDEFDRDARVSRDNRRLL